MTHRESARWAFWSSVWFLGVAAGLLIYGFTGGGDEVVPSVTAATVIAVACSAYSSRESKRAREEIISGESPPEEHGPPEA